MSIRPRIKPCPFCGGEAILDETNENEVFVGCCNCYALTGLYCYKQDAIDAWNRRIEPTFTPDEIDVIARYMRQDFDGNGALERAILNKCNRILKR